MSEAAKAARAANKAKAMRMSAGDPHAKIDASDWTPPEMLNTEAKTGLRPVSRRAYKKGGKVVEMMGEKAHKNAGRKARKSGGKLANEIVTRNVKDANAEAFGKPHIGGYKKGGAAHKDLAQDKKLIREMVKPKAMIAKKDGGAASGNYTGGTRPTGGRIARKHGGKTGKGKTNINIIIGAGGHQQPPNAPLTPPNSMMPVRPPPSPIPVAPPQASQPMPMPGAGAGLPPSPMQRKSGGRVGNRRYSSFKDMDAGAGGGLGRLEKTEIQQKR